MKTKSATKVTRTWGVLALAFLLSVFSFVAHAQTFNTIYNFTGASDGGTHPYSNLISDGSGNLYGTTSDGGDLACQSGGCGVVFELSPNGVGGWNSSVLYAFPGGAAGSIPTGGLLLDSSGNLYGATLYGGSNKCGNGCGVVFKLTPGVGTWAETVLYAFVGRDGDNPTGNLTMDSFGNIFGATTHGGIVNLNNPCQMRRCGTVFELSPNGSGSYTSKALHRFSGGHDGNQPQGSLVLDASGNVWGETLYGGKGKNLCPFRSVDVE